MFSNGNALGQVRVGYVYFNRETTNTPNTSATAIGGQLKYETASLYGINFGAAFHTSNAIRALSGDDDKYDPYLSSSERSYTELAEAYLNYKDNGFNVTLGRQLLETPLTDGDIGISMTPNTFEAYMLSYTVENFVFTAGNIRNWQGFDSGYANVTNNSWTEIGADGKGAYTIGGYYANDIIEASIWFYNMDNFANIIYLDAILPIQISDEIGVTIGAQFLTEDALNNNLGTSSNIDGDVGGLMLDVNLYGVGIYLAANKANTKSTTSIAGIYGAGPWFTSMDNLVIDSLTAGQGDATVKIAGLSYRISEIDFTYFYGSFKADAIAGGNNIDVNEQNFYISYAIEDKIDWYIVFTSGEDKNSALKTDYDTDYIRTAINYNF